MTNFALIDLMIRGGSLSLLMLWSWLLVRDYRGQLAARVAVAMNITIAMHVVASIPGPIGQTPLDIVFELGSACVPPLFWIFARTWFNDAERIGKRGWVAIGVSVGLISVALLTEDQLSPTFYAAAALLRASMFVFGAAGLWEAWRGRDGDLVEPRRALRLQLVVAVGTFILIINGLEVAIYSGLAPLYWRSLIELGILILTFGLCAKMFVVVLPMLFEPTQASTQKPAAAPGPEDQALVERLRAHMAANLVWRDETLTIAALAAQIGEQEYRLRRAINGTLGHRNFAQFLNGYRLAEVKAALADSDQREVPILTIALDAGFGSLGPFNRAFRDAEAMTPSEFRAAAMIA